MGVRREGEGARREGVRVGTSVRSALTRRRKDCEDVGSVSERSGEPPSSPSPRDVP